MKKLLNLLSLASVLAIFSSCSTDPCDNINCNGNGTAVASADNNSCACECSSGYKGNNCTEIDMTKLAGTYTCVETGVSSSTTFNVTTTVSDQNLLFLNFSNVWSANNVIGQVSGSTITITGTDSRGQKPNSAQEYYVKTSETGSVKFTNGKAVITMKYQVTTGSGNSSTYSAVFTQN